MSEDKSVNERPAGDQTQADEHGANERGSGELGPRRAARRRLLQAGAIGAPLVLTFKSTSAWAISSGCLVEPGDLPVPGQIVAVDENFQPIPNPDYDGTNDEYQQIFVTQDVNDIADGTVDRDRLRALVHNNNIGLSCLQSITDVGV